MPLEIPTRETVDSSGSTELSRTLCSIITQEVEEHFKSYSCVSPELSPGGYPTLAGMQALRTYFTLYKHIIMASILAFPHYFCRLEQDSQGPRIRQV